MGSSLFQFPLTVFIGNRPRERKEKKKTLWMDRTKQVQLSLGNVQFEDVVLKEREGKEYRS